MALTAIPLVAAACRVPYHVDYSIPTGAAAYAQLMGILAGFAFAAIILLIDRWGGPDPSRPSRADATSAAPRRSEAVEATLTCLVGGCISLIIATFLYGTTAAEEQTHGLRGSHMNLFASLAAASGVLLLFYGVNWLLAATSLTAARNAVARISCLAVPVVIYYYLAISIVDERTIAAHCAAWNSTMGVSLQASSGVALLLLLVFVSLLWDRPTTLRLARRLSAPNAATRITGIGIAIVLGSSILVGSVSEDSAPHGYSWVIGALIMSVTGLSLAGWVFAVRATAYEERPASAGAGAEPAA